MIVPQEMSEHHFIYYTVELRVMRWYVGYNSLFKHQLTADTEFDLAHLYLPFFNEQKDPIFPSLYIRAKDLRARLCSFRIFACRHKHTVNQQSQQYAHLDRPSATKCCKYFVPISPTSYPSSTPAIPLSSTAFKASSYRLFSTNQAI